MRDDLFKTEDQIREFIFDEQVATVFDDMLSRSVPLYSELQRMVVEIGRQVVTSGTVYDIGCSTGNTLLGISDALSPDSAVRLVGLEPSPAMREQAEKKLAETVRPDRVEIWEASVQDVPSLPDAQLITMLYTMQFVRPLLRPKVLHMCHESLRPGGVLIMAEKILAESSELRPMFVDFYHDYKHRMGYSSTEILRKREALENVLIPFTMQENLSLLRDVGFTVAEPLLQWYNFAAFVAVRT